LLPVDRAGTADYPDDRHRGGGPSALKWGAFFLELRLTMLRI